MTITFKSVIQTENKDDNIIEFTSNVSISKWNDFTVYEFAEPAHGEMNRIEIKDDIINIFAGKNTFNLQLNKKIDINYQTPNGNITLISFLEDIKRQENHEYFKYQLSSGQTTIGRYTITLDIKNKI